MDIVDSKTVRKTVDRKAAAEYVGVCVMTIDRAIRDGEIDYYRVGRRVLFDPERHLDAFLAKNERRAKKDGQ